MTEPELFFDDETLANRSGEDPDIFRDDETLVNPRLDTATGPAPSPRVVADLRHPVAPEDAPPWTPPSRPRSPEAERRDERASVPRHRFVVVVVLLVAIIVGLIAYIALARDRSVTPSPDDPTTVVTEPGEQP